MYSIGLRKKAFKIFKNSYMFKRGGTLCILGIFKPKANVKYSRSVLMDFNIKDLRVNPSQEGFFDAEQATVLKVLQLDMGQGVGLH